jgi:hypothetical protein
MSRLVIIVAGCIFLAIAVIVLVSDKNWQGALLLAAIGAGLLLFIFRGRE